MAVKIRLQRHGRKGAPIYHIVVADSRAPRDGKFIAKLGTYNPIPNPSVIELNIEETLEWLQKGGQPTETARSVLSSKGVFLKKHLLEGVKKGAFDTQEAERRFELWHEEKQAKFGPKKDLSFGKEKAKAQIKKQDDLSIQEKSAENPESPLSPTALEEKGNEPILENEKSQEEQTKNVPDLLVADKAPEEKPNTTSEEMPKSETLDSKGEA